MTVRLALDGAELRCDCHHKLADVWERGAYNIVGTTRIRIDERGRIVLICPDCGKKTRIGDNGKEAA